MKRIMISMAFAAAAAWALAIPVAAQGRGGGAGMGAGHAAGAAGSMGTMGADHANGAASTAGGNASSNAGGNASGPKAPGELLTQNKQLSTKLSSLLPAGTDLQTAVGGFKNLGQFVAAVHVSHNLGIPFDQLKCTELATKDACGTMTVPSKGSSLGGAISTIKPTVSSSDVKTATKQAQKQASSDMNGTS
jgi:hypothetical protein